MSQANPFMITAVGGYEKDRELNADELAVLKDKLRAFRQAWIVYMIAVPDKQNHAERNRNILIKLAEFEQNFDAPLKLVDEDGSVSATWSCYSFYSWSDEKNYEAFHAVGADSASVSERFRTSTL